MASREERIQQRLRGAQRRHIKDVDFGLDFPSVAPVEEEEESPDVAQPDSLAPEAALLPQLSSCPTPARAPEEQSNTPVLLEKLKLPASNNAKEANISAKRRKLESDGVPIHSARSTRSQPSLQPDIDTVEDGAPEDSLLDMFLDTTNESIVRHSQPGSLTNEDIVSVSTTAQTRARTPTQLTDEVTESPRDAPGSGFRVRVTNIDAIVSASQLLSSEVDTSIADELETPVQQAKRKRAQARPSPNKRTKLRQSDAEHDLDAFEVDELSPDQTGRHHTPAAASESPSSDLTTTREQELGVERDELEEAEAIDDIEAATILKKNQGRRKSRGVRAESPELGSEPTVPVKKKRRGRQPLETTPVQQRQPKQPKKGPSKAAQKTKTKTVKAGKATQAGNPIRITVHRFTNPVVYDEDDAEEADILNSEIPHTKRSGVNPIDVLSEVCTEVIGRMLETLENGWEACDNAGLKREYTTKLDAVTTFGKVLATRLLEHTINLDNGYSLEKRLRDEHKKKLRLRDEILRIRAEREQVALRMDEVRVKHDNEKSKASNQEFLNTNLHDIEMAVDVGKEREVTAKCDDIVGTEILLKRLANEVSNNGSSGGLLNQIKEFNAFLERAAVALESRKLYV